ncbi:MAG: hypothetical protein VX589_14010 [Myxococcota bacterium]|nr:hypothetical protein [Myxococcota bacterium]
MKKWSVSVGAIVVALGLIGCGSEAGQRQNDSGGGGEAAEGGATAGMSTAGRQAAMDDAAGGDARNRPEAGAASADSSNGLRPCDTDVPNECSPGEPPRCNNNGVENCYFNPNGCWQWSEPVPCAEGLSCSNGQCSAECADECREGQRRCSGQGVQICAKDHDADPCTDWGMVQACDDGESCSSGECSAMCRDECGPFDTIECDPEDATKFRRCGRIDLDPCLEWDVAQTCPTGQTCQNNRCEDADACVDSCAEGVTSCNAERNKVLTCVRRDADMCLAPGNPIDCAVGEICCAGACVAGAETCEECQVDARKCDMNGFRVCQQDNEGNLTWGNITPCENGMCANGDCFEVGMSVDECAGIGQRECVPDSPRQYRVCGQFDADPEFDLSEPENCPGDQVCGLAGECVAPESCVNLCELDSPKRCDGNTVTVCGELEGTDCLGYVTETNCPLGQRCSAGQCVANEDGCMDEAECVALMEETRCAANGSELVFCREEGNGCQTLRVTPCGADQICPAGSIECISNMPDPDPDTPLTIQFSDQMPDADAAVRNNLNIIVRAEGMNPPLEVQVTAGADDVTQPLIVPNGEWLTIPWDTTSADDGDILLRVILTDGTGATTEITRPYIVDNGGPAIQILQPDVDATIGSTFVFSAQISDPSGIQRYEMYVGGERAREVLEIDPRITALPVSEDTLAALMLPVDQGDALNPQVTVDPNDIPGLDLTGGPEEVTLRVVAYDNDDVRTEKSIQVQFSDELVIAVVEPSLDDGNFPEVSRPFEFVVDANSPRGIQNVVFSLDEMEIGSDDSAPYSVQIDPARVHGMPTMLCGDEDQHQIKIVVTEVGGREFTGVWCAQWDTTPPEIRMTAPVFDVQGGAGIITRDGDDFPIELELEDGDASPSVEVIVNDVSVGQQNEAPYRVTMDGNAILANTDTHDAELTLLVRATDYLGNVGTIRPEVRVSRADWAITVNEHSAPMVVEGNAAVAFGLYDEIDAQGRIIALRPAGQGGLYWDARAPDLRAGLRPTKGFFYADTTAMGVMVDKNTGGQGFVRISEQGEVWEMLEGDVSDMAAGPQGSTYLSLRQPAHQVRRYDGANQLNWSIQFDRLDGALYLPGAELIHMAALDDGALIIHTKKPDPDVQPEMGGVPMEDTGGVSMEDTGGVSMEDTGGAPMEDAGGANTENMGGANMENQMGCGELPPPLAEIHELHRITPAGAIEWSVRIDGVIERPFLVRDDVIIYLQKEEGAFNEGMCMADIIRAPQARNVDDGTVRWTAQLPLNFEQNGQEGDGIKDNADDFRSDGAYMIFGRNMHSTQTHLFAINIDNGAMMLDGVRPVSNGFSPSGYAVDSAINLELGAVVVRTDLLANTVGSSASRLWYLANDGITSATWDTNPTSAVPNPDGPDNLLTEQVKQMSSLGDNVAVATTLSTGGARLLLIQRNGLQERWSLDLPAGADVQKVYQHAGDLVDARATLFSGEGAIYPIRTGLDADADGDESEIAQIDWRVQREDYEIAQMVSRPEGIYVILSTIREPGETTPDKLDILRIPRNQ